MNRRAAYLAAALSAVAANSADALGPGGGGYDAKSLDAANQGYNDGRSASSSGDHDGGQYGRSGPLRSAYDNGWGDGVYRNGWLDAVRDFFARGLKYERDYQAGWENGSKAADGYGATGGFDGPNSHPN